MQKSILTTLFIMMTISTFANDGNTSVEIIKTGVSFGTVLAVVISWSRNKSLLLAIIHGIFGWLYVIYYALSGPSESNFK
jgi:quinol-cytochrome oxidoreductase complex cytochrome b subunit